MNGLDDLMIVLDFIFDDMKPLPQSLKDAIGRLKKRQADHAQFDTQFPVDPVTGELEV